MNEAMLRERAGAPTGRPLGGVTLLLGPGYSLGLPPDDFSISFRMPSRL